MTAYNLYEAETWFREHSAGSILCSANGRSRACSSYPEARRFFDETREDDSLATGMGFIAGMSAADDIGSTITAIESFSSDPAPDTNGSFGAGGGDFGGGGSSGDY